MVTYSYDDAGRLIGAFYEGGKTITYVYDANGNLLRETRTAFVDSDSDGMDDTWETSNFGNTSRNGTADFDGDGMSDLQEFMAGTDPKNAQSLLRIVQIGSTQNVSFSVQWSSVAGKYYRVQYNDTLLPSGWKNLGGDVLASGNETSKLDSSVPGNTKRFYRVQALF